MGSPFRSLQPFATLAASRTEAGSFSDESNFWELNTVWPSSLNCYTLLHRSPQVSGRDCDDESSPGHKSSISAQTAAIFSLTWTTRISQKEAAEHAIEFARPSRVKEFLEPCLTCQACAIFLSTSSFHSRTAQQHEHRERGIMKYLRNPVCLYPVAMHEGQVESKPASLLKLFAFAC